MKPAIDPNELLEKLAAKAVEQGDTLRQSVRDLTLKALSSREATLEQVNKVLQSVTAGVTQGAAGATVEPAKLLKDALAGMDEAVMKVVEANQIALKKLTEQGTDFEQSQLKKRLDEVKSLESQFVTSVQKAAEGASAPIKAAWAPVLEQLKVSGTQTGAQAQQFAETFAQNMKQQMEASRETAFKAAHTLTQNYATVVSGILMGLSEAYKEKGARKD
jgi:hypothetical protein